MLHLRSCFHLSLHNALADFIRFVRSPHNPILREDDPHDQQEFLAAFSSLIEDATDLPNNQVLHGLVRATGVAALSGKPEVLGTMDLGFTDDECECTLELLTESDDALSVPWTFG